MEMEADLNAFKNKISDRASEQVKNYRKDAERGDASAQNNLASCYYQGEGVDKDVGEAVKWFREAAEQGHAKAQYNLVGHNV
jgi:TPR repeat protein